MAYTIYYDNKIISSGLSRDELFDTLEDMAQEHYSDKKWNSALIRVQETVDEASTGPGSVGNSSYNEQVNH